VTKLQGPALPVVLDNKRLCVVDKPAGWLSVPSRLGASDPRPCVGLVLQEQLGCRLWPTHRLDEEVTGLLVFAKDAAAHRVLNAAFAERAVCKTYLATTCGPPPADAAVGEPRQWTSRLLRGKKRAYVHPAGLEAVTVATLLAIEGDRLRWQLQPRTGRAHQLRVELARRGCPIVGDTLYGSPVPLDQGIALRAVALDFSACAAARELGLPEVLAQLEGPPRAGSPERPDSAAGVST
jgi:tRNA pseudouridine32 synthase/23S rRNA pseudouridine746 synthase